MSTHTSTVLLGSHQSRRAFLRTSLGSIALSATQAWALSPSSLNQSSAAIAVLDPLQSRAFVQWFTRIIDEQVREPNPRWTHRDCAGLVRFAAAESLRAHDAAWQRANAMHGPLPPEVQLRPDQQVLRNQWTQEDGQRGAYVSAIGLAQRNSQFIGRDVNNARMGDLLFYDQGDDQHLMVWLRHSVAYHTGTYAPPDTGMRAVTLPQLMGWRDTRWRPQAGNPNFAGIFRFNFLTV